MYLVPLVVTLTFTLFSIPSRFQLLNVHFHANDDELYFRTRPNVRREPQYLHFLLIPAPSHRDLSWLHPSPKTHICTT